jgi:trk system potassium uptake protein TrkH
MGRFALGRLLRHPAQYVVVAFVSASLVGTALLLLPGMAHAGRETPLLTALFTATSAVCVTGLVVVDTGSHWSPVGEGVILLLIQAGGLGIVTLSSLIVTGLAGRLGLRHRLIAAASTGSLELGQVRSVLRGVVLATVIVEAVTAVVLIVRIWATHGEPFGRAVWLGVFHAVSAFNNAGFGLFRDSVIGYQNDPLVLGVLAGAVIAGGLGFPVWVQIAAHPRSPRRWDLHAKMTVAATIVLLVGGGLVITWMEWTNPRTLGGLGILDSVTNGFFHSVMPRTAGFNSIDMGAMREPTRLITEVLMLIGGGSGSTAGGIKVTTFALLGFVIWAELRGDPDVVVFRRRVPTTAQRQALTVALLAVGGVIVATILLLLTTPLSQPDLLFEAVSALGTVGLTTGITPLLSGASQLIVIALMLLGRVGPPTLFAALVLREHGRLYRHPEEGPIIG